MAYVLMTGGTGLLGEYLLRDLAVRNRPLALIARSNREGSARDRVEQLFCRWENELSRALPRPVVVEGDLTRPALGLTDSDCAWLSRHCDSWLHNAASLTFEPQRADGEPWLSNLGGTERSIELCRRLGIATVHHVSTAYVAGLRQGTILETETDVGQEFANEYEASKCASELTWRAAGLGPVTIYRPAIIVGDSQTGYTSTYHGFYAPLKSLHALLGLWIKRTSAEASRNDPRLSIEGLLSALGLAGEETKNFVPVEWVSQAVVQILDNPAYHGRTYHLTPQKKVTAREVAVAMHASLVEDFRRRGETAAGATAKAPELSSSAAVTQTFAEQVSVYREYWRDDPVFDTRALQAALPHLPCPRLDAAVLKRLCDFAIKHGFGWPKKPAPKLSPAIETILQQRGIPNAIHLRPQLALNLVGAGGARLVFGPSADGVVAYSAGVNRESYEWTMSMDEWRTVRSFERLAHSGWASLRVPENHTPEKLAAARQLLRLLDGEVTS
ncbi:MAG: SDR family oxidoreductase [Planctomycetota bacterium]